VTEYEKIRLLVVDDEVPFLHALSERLRLKNFDVTSADSGESALQAAGHKTFDVAVVDLHMPGMSGQELLLALKERQQFLQILIFTGQGTLSKAMECMTMGAVSYLEKTSNIDQVVEAINEAYTSKLISTYEQRAQELRARK
jgi:DNA-binding NtrC family response regulator